MFLNLVILIGKLHNLARAIADEEMEHDPVRGDGVHTDRKGLLQCDNDGVLGLGLRAVKQIPLASSSGESSNLQNIDYDMKETGKRLFGPLVAKRTTYLSQFILHIAAIGDIVDGTDTTHDFNFFSVVYEWPKDVRYPLLLNIFMYLVLNSDSLKVCRYSSELILKETVVLIGLSMK